MQKGLIRHPSFQLAATAVIILIVSIFFRANKNILADLFLIAAILLVGINWIIILRLIMRHPFLDKQAKLFWMVFVLLIPAIGSIIYLVMEDRKLGV